MLSDKIKSETKAEHIALEKVTLPLIKKSTSRSAYLELLQVFHSFFKDLEDEMEEIEELKLIPDMELRRKSSWLLDEIMSLNGSVNQVKVKDKLIINSFQEALGALYVLEGSTLGGQHIVSMLKKTYPDPDHDFIFFEGYGRHTALMWQSFLSFLNSTPETHHPVVIASAQRTFQQFTDHILLQKV